MESKSDAVGQGHVFKSVEHLKKLLHQEESSSGEKVAINSEEVCSQFSDLNKTVVSSVQKPNSSHGISLAIDIFFLACSNLNHRIRSSASENLRKLVKELMGTHFARIQQDLFHELKKNGDPRSLCVALECFSSLFPLTRPSKCGAYAQNLVPVLLRLFQRHEEALHEVLQEALAKILPTLTPFMSATNIKAIADGLVCQLAAASASYRRMASSVLSNIVKFSRNAAVHVQWLLTKLFDLGCAESASMELISALLLTLQQLFSMAEFPFTLLKQAYCYIVSCLLYRSWNTVVSGLECLQHLLKSTNADFLVWLNSPMSECQIAVDFWKNSSVDSKDTKDSLSVDEDLDKPLDNYFEVEEVVEASSPPDDPDTDVHDKNSTLVISECSCMTPQSDSTQPLRSLLEHLKTKVLSSNRVSAQSLGLTCITCAIDINPTILLSLESIAPFIQAQDPKLRSSVSKLLATIIYSQLRGHHGNISECHSIVSTAHDYLFDSVGDPTPTVLKSVCESLRLCLPLLLISTQPTRVVDFVQKLLPLGESTYWLTKVELLETLGCLDFSVLSLFDKKVGEVVLHNVVFKLIGDSDYRVRAMACECLVSLASTLVLDGNTLLVHANNKLEELFSHLRSTTIEFSFAGIADTLVKQTISPPVGLNHIVWFLVGSLSSSSDLMLQKGCLEALHSLSVHYPPASLPDQWECSKQPFTVVEVLLELLQSSRLAWGVQAHSELLELCSNVFLSCGLENTSRSRTSGLTWGVFEDIPLVQFADYFLSHNIKILSVYVHIVEEREPEVRDKKIQMVGVSPKKQGNLDVSSPGKSKPSQLIQESLNIKPPLVPKDGLGYFANSPHFLKLYDACRAAYTNFQVSLDPIGCDKFSKLLQICHNSLAALFEVALSSDVGKHVEEILLYLNFTVKIDPSGALLCVQQLLNALFGMNTAAQHTHLYSPFVSSLTYTLNEPQLSLGSHDIFEVSVSQPVFMMQRWLSSSATFSAHSTDESPVEKKSLTPIKRALVMKPVNSASEIKDYIGFFEPLVVYGLNQFPYTSSLLLQQRVLFLIVQLMHLKVRYELLDCNHSFFDSVMKLAGMMETGMVKGGEALVPHLFQYLVLLTSDQSKLVTIPQVIQKCDVVMASGHNVTSFAIPALQPLVLALFVRSTKQSSDTDIQREVALNMLLRLTEHSRIIVLLTHVLEFYKKKRSRWQEVSNKIYASLLPRIGKLQVVMDSKESLLALYHLVMAMTPDTTNFQGLITALLKQKVITSVTNVVRWLSVECLLLELMESMFLETSVASACSCNFEVPELKCPFVTVSKPPVFNSDDRMSHLAWFLCKSLLLAAETLYQLCAKKSTMDYKFLPKLIANMLVLMQLILPERYQNLRRSFSQLNDYDELTKSFMKLSNFYPLLTLHFVKFILLVRPQSTELVENIVNIKCSSSSSILLQHGTVLLACSKFCQSRKESLMCVAKSPALLTHNHLNLTHHFLKCARSDREMVSTLYHQLKLTKVASPAVLRQYLWIASNLPSPETMKFLCAEMIPHPLSVIGQAAVTVAITLLNDPDTALSAENAEELLQFIRPYKKRCPELIGKLCSIMGSVPEDINSNVVIEGDIVEYFNKEWGMKMIAKFCVSSGSLQDSEVCIRMLTSLEKEDIHNFVEEVDLPSSLLENCIVHGILLSLNMRNFTDQGNVTVSGDQLHPLLEESVKCLVSRVRSDPSNVQLTRCFVRLLAAYHQFPKDCIFDAESIGLLRDYCLHVLRIGCKDYDPLFIHNVLDCCTLALHVSEVQESVSAEWAKEVVSHLFGLMKKAYPIKLQKLESSSSTDMDLDLKHTKDRLLGILSILLNRKLVPTPHTLHQSLKYFTFTLCRLSIWHGLLITPPVLKGEALLSYKVLDEALMESEVLLEYMQRTNSLGWLTRFQFEERWMQLLGVLNQPIPPDDASQEEYHAYFLNIGTGLEAVTSLLLGTTLRPHMGDPTSSVPMNVHRINEMLFLGSRPGRKLASVRRRLELQIWLECGSRNTIYSYYQNPLLNNYASSFYPPLYTRNVERAVGGASIGYGQVSLSSLWSILFKQTSSGYHSVSEELDVKSCILSLIDLYTHWLREPIHTVLLNHILQSLIMLSDLFAVSSQFEWMLHILLGFHDSHPHEDTHTLALIVAGILKAIAVLKSDGADAEKAVKIIEKSLGSDFMIQTACIRGLLYLSEDPSSTVIPNCISPVMKYIITVLQSFKNYTEDHLMLLWSLTVQLIMDHSQHLKDPNFTSKIFELITHVLSHPDISTALFHCIAIGLELLVLNFSLSSKEKALVITAASSRFVRSDQCKSLVALSLLLCCMYTGEEADVASGLAQPSSNPMETAIQAREQVNNLMERLRHGPETNINVIVDILPQIVIDFLPPMEVLQTVVTDFVSPHQCRPQLSALVMAETFALLLKNGHQSILMEWIILSLDSFVQQEPETKAVWSLSCLLLAASSGDVLRSIYFYVCQWKQLDDSQAVQLLCVAAKDFYSNQCNEQMKRTMIDKFRDSNYSSLLQVSQYCLAIT